MLEDRLRRHERGLARLDHERSCLFDLDGNLLVQVEGHEASVTLPNELLEEHMPRCISSHNHPAHLLTGDARSSANYRHSREDLRFVCAWKPREDRVVFRADGATWVCRLWGSPVVSPDEVGILHDAVERRALDDRGLVREAGRYVLSSGRPAGVAKLMALDDAIMRKLARRSGMQYERMRIA